MWTTGNIFGYRYSVKHYQQPSDMGINRGRISKLMIMRNGKDLCNYDREWDVRPVGFIAKAIFHTLVKAYN